MNKRAWRSVLAIPSGWAASVAGYFLTMVVVGVFNREVFRPDAQFSTGWLLVTLLVASVYDVIGGFVAGYIAQRSEIKHAMGLVLFTWLLTLYFASTSRNPTQVPAWYTAAGLILVIPSALVGGWLRMRQRIMLNEGSQRMIRAMYHSRLVVALLVSFIAFVLVMFWGTVLGAMGLLTILQSFLGKDYHTPVMLPVFIVCFILASILSRRVFRRIMPRDTSLMNDRRQE